MLIVNKKSKFEQIEGNFEWCGLIISNEGIKFTELNDLFISFDELYLPKDTSQTIDKLEIIKNGFRDVTFKLNDFSLKLYKGNGKCNYIITLEDELKLYTSIKEIKDMVEIDYTVYDNLDDNLKNDNLLKTIYEVYSNNPDRSYIVKLIMLKVALFFKKILNN